MITKQQIISSLQYFYKTNNKAPTCHDFTNKSTIIRHFGSWNAALEAAEIPINRLPNGSHPKRERQNCNCILCNASIAHTKQKLYCEQCGKEKYTINMYKYQQKRALVRKKQLINLLGGSCTKCGYNKNLSALSFHHLKNKSFTLDSRSLSNKSWQHIIQESKKCILVCMNCHAEEHNPQLNNLL